VSTIWARVDSPAIHQGFIGMDPSDSNDRQILRLQIRRRALQSRLLMIFAIGSTVILICCCVPILVVQIVFGPQEFTTPADVDAVAKQIAPIVVPPAFTGVRAITVDNSGLLIRVAKYDQDQARGRLLIGQMHFNLKSPFFKTEEVEDQRLQSLMNELYPGLQNLDVKKTRPKTINLHGTDIVFTIDEGQDLGSSTRRRQVMGKAITPEGAIQLVLQVEDGFITDEAIDAMLNSLAAPEVKATP
jgi:hypothetical protein